MRLVTRICKSTQNKGNFDKHSEVIGEVIALKSRLREIMDSRGIKQSHFVRKLGISATTMSAIYRGKTIPTLPVAYKIAKELGMHIDEIWVEESDEVK
jgi:putative transcriptional regulator